MAQLSDIIKEIHDVKELLKVRRKPADTVVVGLVKSIGSKIASVAAWDTRSTVLLSQAIASAGLAHDLQVELEAACDARTEVFTETANVGASAQKWKASGAPCRDQSMRHMNNYLTCSDWCVINDIRSNPDQRDYRVAERLIKLGVKPQCASEDKLIKWAITINLIAEHELYNTWPSYWSIYYRVEAFKATMKTITCRNECPIHIDKYPESPSELPGPLYKAAYDDQDPPVHRYISRYEPTSHHVPLRRTSKLLVGIEEPSQSPRNRNSKSAGSPSDADVVTVNGVPIHIWSEPRSSWNSTGYAWGHQSWGRRDSHVQFPALADYAWNENSSSHAQSRDSTLGGGDSNLAKDAADPAAIGAGSSHSKEPEPSATTRESQISSRLGSVHVQSPPPALAAALNSRPALEDRLDSETIEEIAYQRLLNKKMRRPAAAFKRPAGINAEGDASGIVKKAKVGTAKKIDYKVDWDVERGDEVRSRNAYTSLHYGRAKTYTKTFSEKDRKATLSQVLLDAGRTWDKHMK